ncbi:MAG: hypothetical protein AAFW74_08935, partial [Pseudomonadota bacterium]
ALVMGAGGFIGSHLVTCFSNKRSTIKTVPGPQGVRARSSDNDLIEQQLGWRPTQPPQDGLEKTYAWGYPIRCTRRLSQENQRNVC